MELVTLLKSVQRVEVQMLALVHKVLECAVHVSSSFLENAQPGQKLELSEGFKK